MDLSRAIDAFVRGFCTTRSFPHPYEAHRVGPLWVMRDAPRPKGERKQEIIVFGLSPEEAQAEITAYGHYAWVCVMLPPDEPIERTKEAYKAFGYRYTGVQPMMVHDFQSLRIRECPAEIHRILDLDEAERFNKSAGARQIFPRHLTEGDSEVRLYVAMADGAFVGSVSSIAAGPDRWVSSMHVYPAHRRKGIGSALLTAMLREDKAFGSENSVLLATNQGSKLYASVGYELIGNLLLFTPKR